MSILSSSSIPIPSENQNMAQQAPTLLVLAAGMGSRYGGIKQIEGFGPSGETILEYSIYDAIRAGFGKIVFIVREDIKDAVNAIVAPGLQDRVPYEFAIQNGSRFVPEAFQNTERVKPWGTGHAVLCASDCISEPFAVINADDFYGPEAFKVMADFLKNDTHPQHHAMVGYELGNVLSDFGTVSRGVCTMSGDRHLTGINERTKVGKKDDRIVYQDGDREVELSPKDIVSMNFWGFKPSYFDLSLGLFHDFLASNAKSVSAEFFIPIGVQHIIDHNVGTISVLQGGDTWFGVTYPEDKPHVQQSLNALLNRGIYPRKLWD
jgi:NDP-sugar pyrophosphorylase family protein